MEREVVARKVVRATCEKIVVIITKKREREREREREEMGGEDGLD
jgi:hypothetical protein